MCLEFTHRADVIITMVLVYIILKYCLPEIRIWTTYLLDFSITCVDTGLNKLRLLISDIMVKIVVLM